MKYLLIFLLLMLYVKTCSAEGKQWPDKVKGVNTKVIDNRQKFISIETVQKISGWGANTIRVSIRRDKNSAIEEGDIINPFKQHLKGLKIALQLTKDYGIYVIPQMHRDVTDEERIALWTYIAKNLGFKSNLLGYDLYNEPRSRDVANWQNILLPQLVSAIRAEDTDTYLIIQPGPRGKSTGFATLQPIDDPKVVYSFHFYDPNGFTNGGSGNFSYDNWTYPGYARNGLNDPVKYCGINDLFEVVQPALDFQLQHDVRMLVGEFSALRWADGAEEWLTDALTVFNTYNWDWCYHSHASFNGWNLTYADEAPRADAGNDGGASTERLGIMVDAWNSP